jgi:hypothetical protein
MKFDVLLVGIHLCGVVVGWFGRAFYETRKKS